MKKKIFDRDGKLYRYMSILYHLLVLNLLWVVTSLPLVTLGASASAFFATLRDMFSGSCESEWRSYFHYFKKYFFRSTAAWLVLAAGYLIIFLNLSNLDVFGDYSLLVLIIQLPLLLQLVIINLYVFLIISRYHMKSFTALKAAWILGNRHFFMSLSCVILVAVLMYLGVWLEALYIFLFGSICFMLIFFILNPVLLRHEERARASS